MAVKAGAALLAATVLLSACATGPSPARDPLLVPTVAGHVTVDARTVPGLGQVLTDRTGRTLYMFALDVRTGVTCTGPCAGIWPALAVAADARPTAGPGVDQGQLATVADPNSGARVVTYQGFPLYYYSGDTGPGAAHGQGLFLNGGPWYVLSPAGLPVTTTPLR